MTAPRKSSGEPRMVYFDGTVAVTVNDSDVFERVTGPKGDEWRDQMYPDVRTEDDVLAHFARNAVFNGTSRANQLDGWADLDDDAAHFCVVEIRAG